MEEIVDKLSWKHSVETDEVRELFVNHPRFRFVEKGHRKDENVYAALGQTDAGRYKKDSRALIVSARDMSDAEKKTYGRK